MNEDLFQYIWKMKLFATSELKTSDGETVEIIKTGLQNTHSGPDFFNARIKIGETDWAGNVELHLKSSDWNLHQHQNDAAYQNIILHVVYENDQIIKNAQGKVFKTLEMKPYIKASVIEKYANFKKGTEKIPCEKSISKVPSQIIESTLERMAVERLQNKSEAIEKLLHEHQNNWEETFYIQLAKNFGFKTNAVPFELTARNTPLSVLAKHKNNLTQIEALLFGQAGFLNETLEGEYPQLLQNEYTYLKKKYQLKAVDTHIWKMMRMRPVNFPTIRLAQFASLVHGSSHLFSKVIAAKTTQELMALFKVSTSTYWHKHYHFNCHSKESVKNMGRLSIENIIINTIVPFIFVYGKQYGDEEKSDFALTLLAALQPEKNSIITQWNALGVKASNGLQSQALLQLQHNYCSQKKCLQCSIGHYLLKNE